MSPCHPRVTVFWAQGMLWHVQVCHSVMDQMFHGPEPPQSQAAANDELAKIWSKYSSFPQSGFNPHLRSDASYTDKMLDLPSCVLWYLTNHTLTALDC